jgi:hypothetical protein
MKIKNVKEICTQYAKKPKKFHLNKLIAMTILALPLLINPWFGVICLPLSLLLLFGYFVQYRVDMQRYKMFYQDFESGEIKRLFFDIAEDPELLQQNMKAYVEKINAIDADTVKLF